jgi:hypothetical protein
MPIQRKKERKRKKKNPRSSTKKRHKRHEHPMERIEELKTSTIERRYICYM